MEPEKEAKSKPGNGHARIRMAARVATAVFTVTQ